MPQLESDFDKVLPVEIKDASRRSGNERLIPLLQAKEAIEFATQNLIAVLGVEVLHFLPGGLTTEAISGYGLKFGANWSVFVSENNDSAAIYIDQHSFGEGYGYILTTTSREEFCQLRDHINAK
jgi:hypothetical protein